MSDEHTQRSPEEMAANAAKLRAEERLALAEARKMEAEADVAEFARERALYDERKRLAADEHHHVYLFTTAVGEQSVSSCMRQLAVWERTEPGCPITMVFTSPGGDIISGLALFDRLMELRRQGHHVTTKALGYAASMAGILLQAGDIRVMAKESWLLIHEASFGAIGSFGEVEDKMKWVERIQERILDIFAERAKQSGAPGCLTKNQIRRRWHRKDWWLSSDEALRYGFIDRIE